MRARRAVVAFVVAVFGAFGVAACSGSDDRQSPASSSADNATRPFTLVALGDEATSLLQSESSIRQSWAQQFFLRGVPRSTSFVNLAQQSSTVAAARGAQLAVVRQVRPRVVVVLLGLDDVRAGERIGMFTDEYSGLLADLKAAGVDRILVATLPVAAGAVAPYNAAIRAEARRAGAVVVDLATRSVGGSVDARFGVFVPDADGQRTIADAFVAAYRGAFPDA